MILNISKLLQKNTQQIEQDSLRNYSCHNDMWYSDKKNDIRSDLIFFRTWQSPGAFQSDRFATALAN